MEAHHWGRPRSSRGIHAGLCFCLFTTDTPGSNGESDDHLIRRVIRGFRPTARGVGSGLLICASPPRAAIALDPFACAPITLRESLKTLGNRSCLFTAGASKKHDIAALCGVSPSEISIDRAARGAGAKVGSCDVAAFHFKNDHTVQCMLIRENPTQACSQAALQANRICTKNGSGPRRREGEKCVLTSYFVAVRRTTHICGSRHCGVYGVYEKN